MKDSGVILNGIIMGNRRHVECEIRATRTILDGFSSAPAAFSDFLVVESASTNKLPDGEYEVLVGDERILLRRENGTFLAPLRHV